MARVSVECRIGEVAKRCICIVMTTCVYMWRFTFDSCISFIHSTSRTLHLKHNARRRPPRPSSVHLIKRPRTFCRSDGDDGQWNRMRLAPYTRDHGGQWSYVESPCTGNKQTRNMNDDDTHSTRQRCQLIVESVKWQRGVFVWWWLRVCTCGGSRLIQVCSSFIQHPAHFLSSTTPARGRHALHPFIVLNDHVLSADPTVMTTIGIVCGWHHTPVIMEARGHTLNRRVKGRSRHAI